MRESGRVKDGGLGCSAMMSEIEDTKVAKLESGWMRSDAGFNSGQSEKQGEYDGDGAEDFGYRAPPGA